MAKFVLIDHSIFGIGGHHYEYALHILSVAEQLGYEPILGTNAKFQDRDAIPRGWQIVAPYHRPTYPTWTFKRQRLARRRTRRRELAGRRPWLAPLLGVLNLVDAAQSLRYKLRHERVSREFGAATRRFFEQISLEAGDQVFIPTLSPIDLPGLAEFLRSKSQARGAQWHLQFHYPLFRGRELNDSGADDLLADVKDAFGQLVDALPPEQLHLYTTTDPLTAQFNELGLAPFRTLPYPVNAAFQRDAAPEEIHQPLRATCMGSVRAEKGQQNLPAIAQQLWDEYFATGRLQLVVQALSLEDLDPALRKVAAFENTSVARASDHPVSVVRWPLSSDDYVRLILNTDIGLLMYDSTEYYFRASGILVEMLSAGIPVIVTAGCWLSDQIAESVYTHQQRLRETLSVVASSAQPELKFGVGNEVARQEHVVPSGSQLLHADFQWIVPQVASVYARVDIEQLDTAGLTVTRSAEVLGQRPSGARTPLVVALDPRARRVRLTWRNAYGDAPIALSELGFTFLRNGAGQGGAPLSQVGLIAADAAEAPRLLREAVDHYSHYRSTAAALAQSWIAWHNPSRVVQEVLGQARGECRATSQLHAA